MSGLSWGRTHILCTHIWAATLLLHLFSCRQSHSVHTGSYNHGYTNTNTTTVLHIYSNNLKCKYVLAPLLQTSARLRQSLLLFEQHCRRGTMTFVYLLLLCFRMGGIPAKTHKEEKLLIYLGIIDILQSYRY